MNTEPTVAVRVAASVLSVEYPELSDPAVLRERLGASGATEEQPLMLASRLKIRPSTVARLASMRVEGRTIREYGESVRMAYGAQTKEAVEALFSDGRPYLTLDAFSKAVGIGERAARERLRNAGYKVKLGIVRR